MSKWNESKRVVGLILVGIFLLMLLCNLLTPYLVDDFRYLYSFATEERITSVGDIIPSMIAHANTMNGRLVAHSFVQLFSLLPTWVFDVVNAGMFALQILLMYLICKSSKKNNVLLLVALFSLLWMCEPAFGQVNLWFDGSCNYLWSIVFGLLFTLSFVQGFLQDKYINNKVLQVLYILVAFIAGAYLENGSAPFIFVCGMIWLLQIFYQHKKVRVHQFLALVVSFVGYITIYLAPAEWGHKQSSGGLGLLRNNFIRCMNMYKMLELPLIILVVALVIAIAVKADKNRILLSLVFLAGSLCSNFMLMVASDHPDRCMICPIILLLLAEGILFDAIFESEYKVLVTATVAVLAVLNSHQVITGVNDIYVTNYCLRANEAYIYECKANGQLDIELPMVLAETKYSAVSGLRYLAQDTPENWPNESMAKYYEVNTIIGR